MVRRLGGIQLRSRTSRYQDSGITAAFALFLGVYAGAAFGFYWLMQPTVVKDSGLAAYHPPPMTVVTNSPWVPPAPSELDTAFARATHKTEDGSVIAPKIETKTQEARATPPREHRVRARPNPGWGYAGGRSYGFRPWF
jgi:hypothetical protein